MKGAVDILAGRFGYASILGQDDDGLSFRASPGETRADEPALWVQRGFVLRVQSRGIVVEHSFGDPEASDAASLAEALGARVEALLSAAQSARARPALPDAPADVSYVGAVEEDPFAADPEAVLARLEACRDALLSRPDIAFALARADFVRVSRLFLSPRRRFSQAYAWSQAYLFGVIRRGNQAKNSMRTRSGRKGLEILSELEAKVEELGTEIEELLGAGRVEPGEHTVVMTPEVAGTLAHEAFGHGVEADMFVKGRARATEYLGRRVASDLVTMYDGAAGVDQTGSFLFDDEGNPAGKTRIIDKGILLGGLADSLSALDLGIVPTGNGRRQGWDRKAYARMTNTYFEPGSSSLEEMIASTDRGWLLDRVHSGMEDPRNWGIQIIALVGREIRGGRLTGRVASPVICSGYVPDVLGAVDMVSRDFSLSGAGACGKGHKELVKVSCGGPYVRTRMRLG